MRTEMGFDLAKVVKHIGNVGDFKEKCLEYRGGTRSYEDDLYGELDYFYQFTSGKLIVQFPLVALTCFCEDDMECDCIDDTPFETIILNEKKFNSFFQPNLFS